LPTYKKPKKAIDNFLIPIIDEKKQAELRFYKNAGK
jgi:hypothetical protein